jgi:hypothetical protein
LSETKPASVGSYLVGIFVGTLIQVAVLTIAAVGSGNPDAGYLVILLPISLMLLWLQNCAIGLLPFLLLRKIAPGKEVTRFAFVFLIVGPTIALFCLIGDLWIEGFASRRSLPALAFRLNKAIGEYWPLILAITFSGSMACWAFDKMQTGPFLITCLAIFAGLFSFVPLCVELRAEPLAGGRAYCILVPNKKYGGYEAAVSKSQLSPTVMWANYTLTDGSRGGYYVTNHAVLLLDSPQEYLNWSYRALNFVHDPLRSALQSCTPKPHFAATLK